MKQLDYDQGIYLLEMLLPEVAELVVGKLGQFELLPGYYYYVGTAQQNLAHRLERHLRSEKTLRWHIDYLLQSAEVKQVYTWPAGREMECELCEYLQRFPAALNPIPGFGASDCKCKSHLFYFNYRPNMANLLHMVEEVRGVRGDVLLTAKINARTNILTGGD